MPSAPIRNARQAFAIAADRVLPMGLGRWPLFAVVGRGFPDCAGHRLERFEQLLEGAAQMDAHALDAPLERNLPVLHGLTDIWNRNLLGHATHAVMTYDQRLALLPAYLQQLVMESLASACSVTDSRSPPTPCRWWAGGHRRAAQLLPGAAPGHQHRSGRLHRLRAQRRSLHDQSSGPAGQLLAQTEALANGQSSDDPHRDYPGPPEHADPARRTDPAGAGALIAMYEHAVYVQSVIWNINAFDQFGVELGKQLASGLLPALQGEDVAIADPMTREILAQLKR